MFVFLQLVGQLCVPGQNKSQKQEKHVDCFTLQTVSTTDSSKRASFLTDLLRMFARQKAFKVTRFK